MAKLIEVDAFCKSPAFVCGGSAADPYWNGYADALDRVEEVLEYFPAADAVKLPCKIGDFVWAIRSFHGHKHPQRGIVSDMYFLKDMSLQIVVKYVARGKWGETVFATDKEAYAAIGIHNCPICGAKMHKED